MAPRRTDRTWSHEPGSVAAAQRRRKNNGRCSQNKGNLLLYRACCRNYCRLCCQLIYINLRPLSNSRDLALHKFRTRRRDASGADYRRVLGLTCGRADERAEGQVAAFVFQLPWLRACELTNCTLAHPKSLTR